MTALWIILGVVVVICLLLLAPVKVEVILQDKLSATFKYLFIKHKIHNVNPLLDDKPEIPAEEESDKLGYIKELIEEKGFAGAITELCDILKLFLKKAERLIPHIIVSKFNLIIQVGSDDAAITALEYGAVCAVAYPALGFVESLVKFKKQKIDISCDYNNENSVLEMNAILKIRLFFLIRAFNSFVLSYIKNAIGNNNKKDGATNG
ncbi:MAG: DUF2953 domain-containing protein [Oscillospiraceae bacterium]|nr:DUF2953 domain-containing protein [Oscillospiraceae bacterium]